MLRIFTAPVSVPGERTLQADAATWQALVEQFPRANQAQYAALLVAVRNATGGKTKRVTLPDDLASAVLVAAGVSG